ncbi:MAG: signal peptidase I [Chloroflexi bacterium]|nr:signal peptidase I [Chloroflexota bacterium]
MIITLLIAVVIYCSLQITIKSFKVYNISMLPTIQPNDHIILNKLAYQIGTPQYGDIIIFYSPRHQEDLIKRVIAVPGNRVEVKKGKVLVDGEVLNEPYILEQPKYTMFEQTIPPNNYFVLGDDRNNSDDSHNGWTVPIETIIGRAWLLYWPPDRWRVIQHSSSYTGDAALQIERCSCLKLY